MNNKNKVDSYRLDIDLGKPASITSEVIESKFISPKKSNCQEQNDWWDSFKIAVENPDVSIYEYIRDNIVESLEIESKNPQLKDYISGARQRTIKEILSLKNPKDLKNKLKAIEGNKLLFPYNVRSGIKLSRVIIETYFLTKDEKDPKKANEIAEQAIRSNDIDKTVSEISKSLDCHDEKEIKETIDNAVGQLMEDNNLNKMARDSMRLIKKYLNPDNAAAVIITALPLITWKYRWALAISLGAYSARMSVVHTGKSIYHRIKGDKDLAKQESQKIFKSLKTAGGNILLMALSPKLIKVPKIMLTAVNFIIRKSYDSVLDTVHDMLEQETKDPNSTAISKKIKKKIRGFFGKNKDPLANITISIAKEMARKDVADKMVKVSSRINFSDIYNIVHKTAGLVNSIRNRFNTVSNTDVKDITTLDVAEIQDNAQEVKFKISSAMMAVIQIHSEDHHEIQRVKIMTNKNRKLDIPL